jgi:hypothetical protein
MAAHSTFALMQHADQDAVSAARAGDAPGDPALGALYRFARISKVALDDAFTPQAWAKIAA